MRKIKFTLSIAIPFLFFINNSNAQWIQANTGLTVQDVNSFAVIGTNIFAGTGNISGNGQGVFMSTDNGTNWTPVNTGLSNLNVRNIIASGTNLFAAIGADTFPANGGIFLSTNNGTNWTPVNNGFPLNHAHYIAVLGTTLYASMGGGGNNVYISTDNGSNWTIATDPILVDIMVKTIITSGSNIIAASDLGGTNGVFISSDGGTTWSATSVTGETDDLDKIGNTVFAANGTGVYTSTDDGVTWNPTTTVSGIIDNAISLAVIDTMLIVGCPYSVYSSCDKGVTWTDISAGAGGANLSIEAFGMDGTNIYAGNTFHSVGIWKRPLSELSCSGTSGTEQTDLIEFNMYPNPSTEFVYVELASDNMGTIDIINMQGEVLQTTSIQDEKTTLDVTGLSTGIYLIKVVGSEGTAVKKLVKE